MYREVQGATQKLPKFFCHSFTTYWNFYSPHPLRNSPIWRYRFQRDFRDRKHFWKSFCVSVFITFCDMVWISLMLSKVTPWATISSWRRGKNHRGQVPVSRECGGWLSYS
jgi:hypothetical protein